MRQGISTKFRCYYLLNALVKSFLLSDYLLYKSVYKSVFRSKQIEFLSQEELRN